VSIQNYKKYRILIEECNFEFEFKRLETKKFYTKQRRRPLIIRKLSQKWFSKRYGNTNKAQARVIKELKVINDLNFSGYFLITWDIIQYSKVKVLCM
jgi:DNA polymerase-3 subunit alpha/error-prone DNA polymerase